MGTKQNQETFQITSADLDANGFIPWTKLEPRLYKASVAYLSGAAATCKAVYTTAPDNSATSTERVFDAELNGNPVQFTANKMIDCTGPAWFGFQITSLVGTLEVTIKSTSYSKAD